MINRQPYNYIAEQVVLVRVCVTNLSRSPQNRSKRCRVVSTYIINHSPFIRSDIMLISQCQLLSKEDNKHDDEKHYDP